MDIGARRMAGRIIFFFSSLFPRKTSQTASPLLTYLCEFKSGSRDAALAHPLTTSFWWMQSSSIRTA